MFFLILLNCIWQFFISCGASYHEQYRVPNAFTEKWESYLYDNKEYIVHNFPVNWDSATFVCRGEHNASLAVLDNRNKADFLAEAMSESQFAIDSVWIGARRKSADDPGGYRWRLGSELQRTAVNVLGSEDGDSTRFPVWLNRTRIPVPEAGADCVAFERVSHDRPVFLDLPCSLERPFVCEKESESSVQVSEVKQVRCRTGLYHVYDGRMDWHQAAAYCVLRKMSLANIATMRCLKKLGMTMLKARPSIENAWVGAKGVLGHWSWVDTGSNIFNVPAYSDTISDVWPPMRDRTSVKQSGCLQLDRHASHSPVFMEARCERKMQFICYEAVDGLMTSSAPPSDDIYYYTLVRQLLYWQHAFDNCKKMNGTLASLESNEVLVQLLLAMGENKEEPITHIWVSGRLNMTKDVNTDVVNYAWFNPGSGKRIPDPKSLGNAVIGLYMPPWLNEEFSTDNSCLNLDRQDHLNGLVYGLPCDTAQYSICMIEKSLKPVSYGENVTDGYETL